LTNVTFGGNSAATAAGWTIRPAAVRSSAIRFSGEIRLPAADHRFTISMSAVLPQ